jgi:hypothetical protein
MGVWAGNHRLGMRLKTRTVVKITYGMFMFSWEGVMQCDQIALLVLHSAVS